MSPLPNPAVERDCAKARSPSLLRYRSMTTKLTASGDSTKGAELSSKLVCKISGADGKYSIFIERIILMTRANHLTAIFAAILSWQAAAEGNKPVAAKFLPGDQPFDTSMSRLPPNYRGVSIPALIHTVPHNSNRIV